MALMARLALSGVVASVVAACTSGADVCLASMTPCILQRYPWNGTTLLPITQTVRATELYNHTDLLPAGASPFDSFENVNLAPTANSALLAALRERLHQEFAI